MSGVEIEYQEKIPILILNSNFQYYSDLEYINSNIGDEVINNSNEIIIDLSNFYKVDAEIIQRITAIFKMLERKVKRFGLVIPSEVIFEGLKIKLIEDLFEVYGTKYDAVYNLLC